MTHKILRISDARSCSETGNCENSFRHKSLASNTPEFGGNHDDHSQG